MHLDDVPEVLADIIDPELASQVANDKFAAQLYHIYPSDTINRLTMSCIFPSVTEFVGINVLLPERIYHTIPKLILI